MTSDVAAHLREGRAAASWRPSDLWVASLGMGGAVLGAADVEAVADGRRFPSAGEYTTLAVTLNERLADLGRPGTVPRWRDLET
jgi:hypothetical protein